MTARTTTILGVALLVQLCAGSAQANLCDARWWQGATSSSVQASLRVGENPTRPCPNSSAGDYPLHLAALFGNDAPAVQSLLGAGASALTPNAAGDTPIVLFERRYEQAVLSFGQASPALTAIANMFGLEFEAASAAQDSLCSLSWWQNSATGSRAETLVYTEGVDLDASCDGEGNRPLHVALSLEGSLSADTYYAITWLVYAGAGNLVNRRGETPLSVVETRYQRTLMRWDNIIPQICHERDDISQEFADEFTRREASEVDTYYYMRVQYAGESREEVRARTRSRMAAHDCSTLSVR